MTTTADIRALARAGRLAEAEAAAAALIEDVTGRAAGGLSINRDRYSLNSVNGFARLADVGEVFFKFHQEEDEEGVGEYYNARILAEAGYAVDEPLFASGTPGRQILVYRRRENRRFSDVCRDLEDAEGSAAFQAAVAAQRAADREGARIARATLHRASAAEIAAEPIHQLFHRRLVDSAETSALGGRARRFYLEGRFEFPGVSASWSEVGGLPWRINGRRYPMSLAQALELARSRLDPRRLGPGPACVAHGDAHNANVWYEEDEGGPARLCYFDPAFAGRHVPALLAEVKATFHNIFAHPLWLYDAEDFAARHEVSASLKDGEIVIETAWRLSPLRHAFLESKAGLFWKPLLDRLAEEGSLPEDWQETLRAALFACPSLVMDLSGGPASPHNAASAANGLAVAMMCAQAPETGSDPVADFFSLLD